MAERASLMMQQTAAKCRGAFTPSAELRKLLDLAACDLESAASIICHNIEMPKWRPIETAPKDGRRILLCSVSEDLQTGAWAYLDGPFPGLYDTGWRWGGEGKPSHWTPLLAAPASTDWK